MLRIVGLSKTFAEGARALVDASLEVKQGEFVVVLGPSGAGKTTLLRLIGGLSSPDAGEIILDGVPVVYPRRAGAGGRIAMVFQDFNLVGNLTALNNVLTGLLGETPVLRSLLYLFPREHKLRALECLDRVGILNKAYVRADHLSGGQQQRVGIARALVRRPLLLLADEPVASLDPLIAFNILKLLKDINKSEGITVVCNLHQVDLALRFADRVVGLINGRIAMDEPVARVDATSIQKFYAGHDRGLYYGPESEVAEDKDLVRLTS
jgi:phosphonate transport system ATP-binding protein